MSGLVFAGIAPHGHSIIGEIAENEYELYSTLREGMEVLGQRLKKHDVDIIVVLTPHGLRLKGCNAIYTCEYCRGTLNQFGSSVSTEFKCNKSMALDILSSIETKGIPCVGCNFGALEGPESNIEMDWGTFIPLWFCGAQDNTKPEIVVIGPTREIPLEQLVAIGNVIAETAEKSGKKVALIASADQAHTHTPEGPYGYDASAKIYDDIICDIVKRDALNELLDIDMHLVSKAMPDSLWQMLILSGALEVKHLKGSFIAYQVPSYFGMLVASYE
jgi:aromatic ring-opening dioxygenase LigB subunit